MDLVEHGIEFGILVVLLTVGFLAGGFAERRHLRLLAAREAGNGDFLISQVKSFPDAVYGARAPTIVIGEAVIATDYFKTFIAMLRKIFGGELRSYNSLLARARREALQRLVEQARERGYNALCNVRFDSADVGGSSKDRRAAMVAILASADRLPANLGFPMTDRSRDQSIDAEPHLQDRPFKADPSEIQAKARLHHEAARPAADDAVDHTVWDEVALSPELAGPAAESDLTYATWLRQKQAETSWAKSLAVTLLVVLVAGPWGVLGALAGSGESAAGLAMVVVIGPVTEEIMKVAAALWIVEKRPYLFKSIWQILLCAVAGGAAFGLIENLMYLYVYLPDHSAKLAAWRWTVCTGLHMNCSFVAGVGLARIWYNAMREQHRPQLWLGIPWLVTAMIAHGAYNATVTLAEAMHWLEL